MVPAGAPDTGWEHLPAVGYDDAIASLVAFEALLGGAVGVDQHYAHEEPARLAKKDPDMLALTIGALLRYKP